MVVGVSKDGKAAHQKFIAKYELPFTLLSDEDAAICTAYGVYKEKSMYGRKYMGIERSTFVIDASGRIKAMFPEGQGSRACGRGVGGGNGVAGRREPRRRRGVGDGPAGKNVSCLSCRRVVARAGTGPFVHRRKTRRAAAHRGGSY